MAKEFFSNFLFAVLLALDVYFFRYHNAAVAMDGELSLGPPPSSSASTTTNQSRIHRSACRRDALFKLTDTNQKLSGVTANLVGSSHVKDLSFCVRNCIKPLSCRSVNYKKNPATNAENNCELLDILKGSSGAVLTSAPGWKHYEPISQVGPRCRLVQCPPGRQCAENCTILAGYTCVDIDECNSNPCQNSGTCSNLANQYQCTCAPGWTGTNCETNVNECASTPCKNAGSCIDQVNQYICNCTSGWTGTHCETNVDECTSSPCKNAGTCVDGVNGYTCNCASGWTGTHCETDVNECTSNPCLNSGTCHNGINQYTCTCPSPYTGPRCATKLSECHSSPCLNGGTCAVGLNKYTCMCTSYWGGLRCQLSSRISSCKQLKEYHSYTANGIYTLYDKSGSSTYSAYCNMEYGGWTLIARFSNADSINWVASSGSYLYDVTETGYTTSTTANSDMVSKAFHNAGGFRIKITRTDSTNHQHLLYTDDCLKGSDFRTFITSFGNFRNGASWVKRNSCHKSCTVGQYSSLAASTSGFKYKSCSSSIQSSNKIGFWCHYSSGDCSVMMIGGGGSSCGRADHGLAVTEENYPRLGLSGGAKDFGDDGYYAASSAYALNLWVK